MVIIVAAIAKNGVIGKDQRIPWHIREDMEHFKKLTQGKIVLMGRKTFESILGYLRKPLPNRKNIVITRQASYNVHPGVEIYPDPEEAFKKYEDDDVYVIGGAEIYKQTLPLADKLFITEVHQEMEGDAHFPEINRNIWQEIKREDYGEYSFVEYSRLH